MKAVPEYFPDWIHRATVQKRGGTVTHALADDAATLVYLAGQNVVTPHVWLSRADEPRKPDRLILDFDPSGGGFADVRAAARDAGERPARRRARARTRWSRARAASTWSARCAAGRASRDVHGFARRAGGGDGGATTRATSRSSGRRPTAAS